MLTCHPPSKRIGNPTGVQPFLVAPNGNSYTNAADSTWGVSPRNRLVAAPARRGNDSLGATPCEGVALCVVRAASETVLDNVYATKP